MRLFSLLIPKLMKPRPLLNWVDRSTKESLIKLVWHQWPQILHRRQAVLRNRSNSMSDSLAWSEQRLRRCACLHQGSIQPHHNYWSRSRQSFLRRRIVVSILSLALVRTILYKVRGKWRRDLVEILSLSNRKTSYCWARRLCPLHKTTLYKTRTRKLVGLHSFIANERKLSAIKLPKSTDNLFLRLCSTFFPMLTDHLYFLFWKQVVTTAVVEYCGNQSWTAARTSTQNVSW